MTFTVGGALPREGNSLQRGKALKLLPSEQKQLRVVPLGWLWEVSGHPPAQPTQNSACVCTLHLEDSPFLMRSKEMLRRHFLIVGRGGYLTILLRNQQNLRTTKLQGNWLKSYGSVEGTGVKVRLDSVQS